MNVKPGDRAVIINSVNGPSGSSVGRIVLVQAYISKGEYDSNFAAANNALNDPNQYCPSTPYERHHTTLGQIWPVTCINGGSFVSEHGGSGEYIDVPDIWLRKIVPTAPKQVEDVKELDLS